MSVELSKYLRRYVTLDVGLAYLETNEIPFRSYIGWDDRSEESALKAYEHARGLNEKSLGVVCFTQAVETHHHWSIYAKEGLCFVLKTEAITEQIKAKNLIGRAVDYIRIDQLSNYSEPDSWPFLKRLPFQDEREFRVISEHDDIALDLTSDMIDRIYISPWICDSSINKVKDDIRNVCAVDDDKVSVYGTTLLSNSKWVRFFNNQKNENL
jgi:hypothetical protein